MNYAKGCEVNILSKIQLYACNGLGVMMFWWSEEKSRIWETPNLLTIVDRSADTKKSFFGGIIINTKIMLKLNIFASSSERTRSKKKNSWLWILTDSRQF